MKKIIILFICLISIFSLEAQSFDSQILYLKFDKTNIIEKSTNWRTFGNEQQRIYFYDYRPLINGSVLEFWCKDRSKGEILLLSAISNYNIKTLPELQSYLSTLTQEQALNYFENVKKYYIVEFLDNNQIEIVPVKLEMTVD